LLKREKQEQRLQKNKTIYTSYSGYANQDPDTVIKKLAWLRSDHGVVCDGGVVEDKLPTNGSFADNPTKETIRGSHFGWRREGIFSARNGQFGKR
jgi:hypothetical protein